MQLYRPVAHSVVVSWVYGLGLARQRIAERVRDKQKLPPRG
jgi:hypothetical protein